MRRPGHCLALHAPPCLPPPLQTHRFPLDERSPYLQNDRTSREKYNTTIQNKDENRRRQKHRQKTRTGGGERNTQRREQEEEKETHKDEKIGGDRNTQPKDVLECEEACRSSTRARQARSTTSGSFLPLRSRARSPSVKQQNTSKNRDCKVSDARILSNSVKWSQTLL